MRLLGKVEERTAAEHPALRARARAILGSSFRRTGQLGDAEGAYAEALELYSQLEEPLDQADLYRRMAHLRRDQGRHQKALDLTGRAALIFLAADDRHSYGLVLNVAGSVYFATGAYPDALRRFGKALANLDYGKSAQAFYAAQNNFVAALVRHPDPTPVQFAEALAALRSHDSRRRRRPTVPSTVLRHLEALVLLRCGITRARARWLLQGAHHDFVELGMPLDVAAVSLDLAQVYLEDRRWFDLRQVAGEAVKLLAQVPGSGEALTAFRLWQTSILAGELEDDLVDRCRGLLVGLRAQNPVPEQLSDAALRRKLRRLITAALEDCPSLEELVTRLQARGVTVHRRPPRGKRPGGLGFELEGLRIHGRRLGRSYSMPGILARLRRS
ncbi:MAG: tetratricopeptide repeat protein [bacterium]|nr:tetratricopeptide repeat protein [bacterium]